MGFKLIGQSKKTQARAGILRTRHNDVLTPCFMPVATHGVVKHVSMSDIKRIGYNLILANVYHLYQKPGAPLFKKINLHDFMQWPDSILTDSGGYQVFSLAKFRKITDTGAIFSSEIDGRKIELTPQEVIKFQLMLHTDILMVLDECPSFKSSVYEIAAAFRRTSLWASMAKQTFDKLAPGLALKDKVTPKQLPLLFGIVQGGLSTHFRRISLEDLISMDFDGYAFGGFFVGEPEEKVWPVLEYTLSLTPTTRARYLMGAGKPEQIVKAVKLGVDMFDCVIPSRNGRHGGYYVFRQNYKKLIASGKMFYDMYDIRRRKFIYNLGPMDDTYCQQECCLSSITYLRYLYNNLHEGLAYRLLSIHNLNFYYTLLKTLRELILEKKI